MSSEKPGIWLCFVRMKLSDVVIALAVGEEMVEVFVGGAAGGAGVVWGEVGSTEHVASAQGVSEDGGEVVVELVRGFRQSVRERGFNGLKF